MYTYIYIYMYIYILNGNHTNYIYIYTYVLIYIYERVYIQINIYIYICVRTNMEQVVHIPGQRVMCAIIFGQSIQICISTLIQHQFHVSICLTSTMHYLECWQSLGLVLLKDYMHLVITCIYVCKYETYICIYIYVYTYINIYTYMPAYLIYV